MKIGNRHPQVTFDATMLKISDYVVLRDKTLFGDRIGKINNIRVDSMGAPLFTIYIASDFYYARFYEIEKYIYGED